MALTPQQQEQIIRETTAWADGFAPLDLSAYPALNPLPPETSRDDGRFSRDYRDTALSASASQLREFVSNPDNETLSRISEETGNKDLMREVRDQRGEAVAIAFKRKNPRYIPTQDNYSLIVQTLAFNALSDSEQGDDTDDTVDLLVERGYWTVENLERCYAALSRDGMLDVPYGTARNLSEGERLRVARLAQAGRIEDAIGFYLSSALPDVQPSFEMLNDPAYKDVCSSAVWTVFEDITLDYVPTPQRESFMRRQVGNRPVTIPMLQSAWSACQKNEAGHSRSELLGQMQQPEPPAPVSAKQLDELDDSAVERLYHDSLRTYAQSFQRPRAGGNS